MMMTAAVADLEVVQEATPKMHHFAESYFHYCQQTGGAGAGAGDGYDYGDGGDGYCGGDDGDGRHSSVVHPGRQQGCSE